MSLVIDADGHVEENLAELVGAIPAAMEPHAMRFVSVAGGHVTYEIEGRLWRSKYPYPGGLQNHVSAGGERREGGRDPKVRLQVLEDEGIDAAVLYPSVGMMFGLLENPDIAAARRSTTTPAGGPSGRTSGAPPRSTTRPARCTTVRWRSTTSTGAPSTIAATHRRP